jgi:LysM repeat protein
LADGTNDKYYLSLQIQKIQAVLPKLEKAYLDVDKLSNSISKVAYKDLDTTFIFAFMIIKWAAANGVDPMEVAGIAMTESQFNPKAVSKANARGLMQIHKESHYMKDYFDVEENIKKGAQILWMFKKSNPQNYLSMYSGGAENYEAKVKANENRIRQIARTIKGKEEPIPQVTKVKREPIPQNSQQYQIIKVKGGDTLNSLSQRVYGTYNHKIADAVQKENPHVKDLNLIYPDQQLKFPVIS